MGLEWIFRWFRSGFRVYLGGFGMGFHMVLEQAVRWVWIGFLDRFSGGFGVNIKVV